MKQAMLVLAVVSAMVGCGEPLPPRRYHVYLDGYLCYGQLYSEVKLKQEVLDRNVAVARDVLLEGKVFQDTQEFCNWMQDMLIVVRDRDRIMGKNLGAYSPFHGIELNRFGSSMVHEILHSVDYGRLSPAMGTHNGWTEVNSSYTMPFDYMGKYYKHLTEGETIF